MRHSWPLLLVLAACTSTEDDTGVADDTGADTDTEDTEDIGPAGILRGTVKDASGTALEGAQVNMCLSACTTVSTNASGAYAFEGDYLLPVGTYSFHIVPPFGQALAQPLVPYAIAEDADTTVDVVLPALGADVALPTGTAAEVEIAPGLFVTAKVGDLTVVFEDPPSALSGTLVQTAQYLPMPFDADDIVAVWYTSPYEASAEDAGGLPLRIRNDWALADGTYEVWASSYWDYAFVKVGDFTATSTELTNSAARLEELTTIVLVKPN